MPSPELTLAEAFTESIVHDRHVVLARELKPFCLDHWELLNSLESPFTHGGTPTLLDLQRAVQACSTGSSIEFYDASLRPPIGWRLWLCLTRIPRFFSFERELAAFNEYLQDYLPRIARFDSAASDTKCPALFLNAAALVGAGHDPVRVRRMPLGEMIAWTIAMAERAGDPLDKVKSETDIEADRLIAAAAEQPGEPAP